MDNFSLLMNEKFWVPESTADFIVVVFKSFYASVEYAERALGPFKTNLVVADPDRFQ